MAKSLDFKDIRPDYCHEHEALHNLGIENDPFAIFRKWMENALSHKDCQEPQSCCLSTCTRDALPFGRMVYAKTFDENGITFFTNYNSKKGKQIADNPVGSLCFYWFPLHRQVIVRGKLDHLSDQESDEYFSQRPIASQISAIISKQSQPLESRENVMPFTLSDLHLKGMQQSAKERKDFDDTGVSFAFNPFLHGQITNFVTDAECMELLNFCKEQVNFKPMQNDLYSFEQSDDIASLLRPVNPDFVSKLLSEFPKFLSLIFGFQLNDRIHLTASKYKPADYLLCHNDLVGDNKEYRKVAFVYYVQCSKQGGSLDLFQCNPEDEPVAISKSIIPYKNSVSFFEVSNQSYHQVSEILSTKADDIRISIHGWFHTNAPSHHIPTSLKPPYTQCAASERFTDLEFINLINPIYLNPDIQSDACTYICSQGDLMLNSFLTAEFFNEICIQLPLIQWTPYNIYHKRSYEVANKTSIEGNHVISKLLNFFTCPAMLLTMSNLCGLDLTQNFQDEHKLSTELRRVMPGSYSLLWSPDTSENDTSESKNSQSNWAEYVWASIFFAVNDLQSDLDGRTVFARNNCADEVLHVDPCNNSLNIVIVEDAEICPFLHYCNQYGRPKNDPVYYQLVLIYRN